jgi:hypothetical protein
MRTRAECFGFRSTVTKFVMAGALIVVPAAALCAPTYAAPVAAAGVQQTQLPADTPMPPPPPPPPPPAPHVSSSWDDYYCGSCDGGGGGGGGG